MEFGLGLILSFTDNATVGINNAVNSLNQLTSVAENASNRLNSIASLSALSVISDRVGSAFLKVGKGVFDFFGNVLRQTRNIGMEFENFDVTLTALFGGAEEGAKKSEQAMVRLFDFAKKSPLKVGDVKDMIVTLQSQGINAFDETTGAITGTRQEFLAFLTDLKSFKPEVANQRFKMAIQNYIGSGEKKMMRTVFDMGDIEKIIGHAVSDTAEGRMNDIVEMVEKKGLTGLSASMAETWGGVASNISDAFTQIYYSIANSGVFDKLKSAFMEVANTIIKLSPERLQVIGKTIGEGLNIIVDPITKVAKVMGNFVDKIIKLCETNPALVKLMMTMVVMIGTLFSIIGVVLKVTSAFSGFSLMILASGKSISQIATTMKVGLLKMIAVLLPFIVTIGLLRLAWKNDFAGIRTDVTNFVVNLRNSFNLARDTVKGSVGNLVNTLGSLQSKGDFFSNITISIMKFLVLIDALKEGWNGFTLSEETFEKANELGLLPLIESIFILKDRFDLFKQGFEAGWKKISETVEGIIDRITSKAKGTIFETMLNTLTDFLQKLSDNDPQAWYDLGEKFAEASAKALMFIGTLFLINKAIALFQGLGNMINGISMLFMANPIVASILLIVAAFGILYATNEDFRNLVNDVFGEVKQIMSDTFKAIEPIVKDVFGKISENLPQLKETFQTIGNVLGDMFKGSMETIAQLLPVAMEIFGAIGQAIMGIMPTVMNIIGIVINIFSVLFEVAGNVFNMIMPFIVDIAQQIGGLISDVLPIIVDLINDIGAKVTTVVNLILPMIKSIMKALTPIIQTILDIGSKIVSRLVPIIKSVVNIVSNVIKAIMAILMPIITFIVQIVQAAVVLLAPVFNTIMQAIGFITDIVLGFIQIFMAGIDQIVAIVSGAIQVIMSIINMIVQFVMTTLVAPIIGMITMLVETICSIWNGIIEAFQFVWDMVVNVWSGAINFFTGIFTGIFNTVSNIFNNIANVFTQVWNGIVTAFTTIGDTISGAIKGAVNKILSGAVRIINGFLSAINFAIGVINAIPGVSVSKVNMLSVPALAQGGIIEKPTVALVGEAGKEAVMPLENNTGWIGVLANKLSHEMGENRVRPVNNSSISNSTVNNTGGSYLTTTNNTSTNIEGDTNNTVKIEKGAIQINVQNATEEEATRMAKFIMQYIQRQQELKSMAVYS